MPIAVFYAPGLSPSPPIVGALYFVSSLVRHSDHLEVQGRFIRRVQTTSVSPGEVVPITPFNLSTNSSPSSEFEELVQETLLRLSTSCPSYLAILSDLANHSCSNLLLADLALNRLALFIAETTRQRLLLFSGQPRDPFGILAQLESAYFENDLLQKAKLVHSIQDQLLVALDLFSSIRESEQLQQTQLFQAKLVRHLQTRLNSKRRHDLPASLAKRISHLPASVQSRIDQELSAMSEADPSNPEYALAKNYIEWLARLPWTEETSDVLDIQHTKIVLDSQHFGLDHVKTSILYLVANATRTRSIESTPLLLVGPPGTGKTTVAFSIAEALGRRVVHLAGLTESTDLRGFRRTYVNSAPGKLMTSLCRAQCRNPVVILDELDKIDDQHTLKPVGPVLLELLSREQNNSFLDHYIDLPFDLSRCLFIATANSTESIPAPLLSRLHVIHVLPYSEDQKIHIAERHLIPDIQRKTGLPNVSISSSALENLVQTYTRHESGVRQLQLCLEKLYRKVAVKLIREALQTSSPREGDRAEILNPVEPRRDSHDKRRKMLATSPFSTSISSSDLRPLLGAPEPQPMCSYYHTSQFPFPVGVSMSLVKTTLGCGFVLVIEARTHPIRVPPTHTPHTHYLHHSYPQSTSPRLPPLLFTGSVLKTMQESSLIALICAQNLVRRLDPHNVVLHQSTIHLHAPHASVQKDGPSAGCAIACALVSLALGVPLKSTWCMTGELALNGYVLKVGGVIEKALAAHQARFEHIVLPIQNQEDWETTRNPVRQHLQPHYVKNLRQIIQLVLEKKTLDSTRT